MAQDRDGRHGGDWRDRNDDQGRRLQGGGPERGAGRGEDRSFGGHDLGARYGYHFGQHPYQGVGEGHGQGYGAETGGGPRFGEPGGRYGERQGESGRGSRDRSGAVYGKGQRRIEAGEHRGRGPKGYRRSDERILEDVNRALTDDPFVDASDVEVHVKDGDVTLSGAVRSRDERRRADMLAEQCSGVENIQNDLRVQ